MKMKNLIVVALAVSLLALGGCTTKVVTESSGDKSGSVTASGTGKTSVAPDVAQMSFGATASDADAKKALTRAGNINAAIIAAVKKLGVAKDDIQTANVSVYPIINDRNGKPTVTGYNANVQVSAKIRDMTKIGDVIDAAGSAGATDINGPSFTIADDSEARNQAIELAIADARKRAGIMAKAAGKTLGNVLSVTDSSASAPPIPYSYDVAARGAKSAVPIETGMLEIESAVTVIFELR